ncbi:aminopeptidase N [Shewanella baltica OS625]|uniref:aminopeptidase N n=1 Tax=Shewanella baltica TaxID=62322 RepID=UPI000230D963|nr:aminopeptidase N [Shewanella baltica]EHC07811.1 aminopeptidase N [Shewanella baltica OS625]
MNLFKASFVALACGALMSCATQSTFNTGPRDASAYISQYQAALRSQIISDVRYELDFQLTGEAEFSATSKVTFQLSEIPKQLSLDLNKAQIKRFIINGTAVYPNYNGAYISLNTRLLTSGENTVEVQFTRPHSTNGEGLHRFKDPVDGKVYLYSHFEPAAAQQMFAVFDQPDIKANYQITVTAPKDWQVISTMRESQITPAGAYNRWTFPDTPKLSPYNFSMHAGPYHMWQDNSGRYPMRLFARESVANQVTPQDWFNYTKQGLTFFDNYFGIPYPFKKYDQILVPDFLYGAMENAGAVTFAEDHFLYKAAMTAAQKQSLAGVIMHEMAHQWFGDLVTMKWWNGLWLNESFASFMGTLATQEATEFTNAWRTFYAKGKQRAYEQDSLVTTHPIEVPVATTQNAFDNIDAITYQKGASTLKQLRHLLGDMVFRRGVSNYLKQYSYQNAELDDFINSLGKAAGRDLSAWTQEWLYSAGVNTIKAEYRCEGNRISDFSLIQIPASAELPTLREQKVQVALFTQGRFDLRHDVTVPVTYKGERTEVKQLIGERCPDLVYPNFDDWGFVKVELDDKSFNTAKQQLSNVSDPLLRSMLWQSLWDSVREGKLSLDQYLSTVFVNAPAETDYTIVGQIIDSMLRSKQYLAQIAPIQQNYAENAIKGLSQMSLRKAMESKGDNDFQRIWFDAYVSLASDRDSLRHLAQLVDGETKIKGLTLDQDLRWAIITQLNRYDFPNAQQRLTKEAAKDNSDSGEKAALAAQVIRPEAAAKRRWLSKVHQDSLPFSKQRIIMENLYPAEQKLLSAATAEERLASLRDMDKKGPVFMRNYAHNLIPTDCNYTSIAALDKVLDSQTGLSNLTRRNLLETRQIEQRCVLIKNKMTQ